MRRPIEQFTLRHLKPLAPLLAKWLDARLEKGDDWWDNLVLFSLAENQRAAARAGGERGLAGLGLQQLLRVADKNWHAMTRMRPPAQSARDTIVGMLSLCHRLHGGGEIRRADLRLLHGFGALVGADRDALKEMRARIGAEDPPPAIDGPAAETPAAPPPSETSEIKQGGMVRLKSSPGTKGIVTAAGKVGGKTKYTVFAENSLREFFGEQLEACPADEPEKRTSADGLRRRLCARRVQGPPARGLYSLNAAKIDFVPYQFRPVLKLVKSDEPRLLIADGVGVGKTIEAGLIMKELQARAPLDNAIIVCPKPLVSEGKWRREMKDKFGEDFIHADGAALRGAIHDYGRDGVWGSGYSRLIVPYSILTEKLLKGDGRHHSGLEALDPPPRFDLLIVDEAHHIRNSETQAHKAVKYLCEHSAAAVFLTATPVQMGSRDLFALLNLLFPDDVPDYEAFLAMARPNAHINRAVSLLRAGRPEAEALAELRAAADTGWGRSVIAPSPAYRTALKMLETGAADRGRRLSAIAEIEGLHSFSRMLNRTRRQDIGDFCMRRVHTLGIDFTREQRELHDELLGFEREMLGRLHGAASAKFLISTISRQASSSLFAIAPFVGAMLERRFEMLVEELGYDGAVTDIELGGIAGEMEKIKKLAETLPAEDPKFGAVRDVLAGRRGAKTMLFSSFRHTLDYLQKRIGEETGLRAAQVNGGVCDDERYRLRERFELPPGDPDAIDVLLFTEVGSEGLDYQFCDTLLNYDLPWNPMRIEQRIGRIDRRGQHSEVVHIYNCVMNGTVDADIYHRCFARIGVFEAHLGECSEILGDIEGSIREIVFDSKLTDAERRAKLEKMADNEMSLIRENRRLEDESRDIFGINMADIALEIAGADEPWASAGSVRNLVEGYLGDRLGQGRAYISGGKLGLAPGDKAVLLEDYRGAAGANPDRVFEAYLKGGRARIPIAFHHDEAKALRNGLFANAAHPLARMAAAAMPAGAASAALAICGDEIPKGTYPFLLYSWQHLGPAPRTEFVAVCEDGRVGAELMYILRYAATHPHEAAVSQDAWRRLDEKHAQMWEAARIRFREQAAANCVFKTESLKRGLAARTEKPRKQLLQSPEAKIERMYRSQIEREERYFAARRKQIEQDAARADIHAELVARGVLVNAGRA